MAFLDRFRRAIRHFWEEIADSAPAPVPAKPEPVTRRAVPLTPQFNDSLASLRHDVYERIADWHLSNFSPRRMARNVALMTEFELDMVMAMDVEEFRQMASVNPHFWYH